MKIQLITDLRGNVVATGGTSGSGDGTPSGGGVLAGNDQRLVEVDLPDDIARLGLDRLHYRFRIELGDSPCLMDLETAGAAGGKGRKQKGVYPVRLLGDPPRNDR